MLSIMKVMAIYAKKTQYFTWLLLLFSTLATNRTALEYFSHVKKKRNYIFRPQSHRYMYVAECLLRDCREWLNSQQPLTTSRNNSQTVQEIHIFSLVFRDQMANKAIATPYLLCNRFNLKIQQPLDNQLRNFHCGRGHPVREYWVASCFLGLCD